MAFQVAGLGGKSPCGAETSLLMVSTLLTLLPIPRPPTPESTVMGHVMTGTRSEKCVVGQFRHCASIAERGRFHAVAVGQPGAPRPPTRTAGSLPYGILEPVVTRC